MSDSCDSDPYNEPGTPEWTSRFSDDGTPDPPESDAKLRPRLREGGGLCLLAAIGLFAAGWHFLASFFVPLGILFAIVSVACFTLAEVRSDEKPAPVSLKKD